MDEILLNGSFASRVLDMNGGTEDQTASDHISNYLHKLLYFLARLPRRLNLSMELAARLVR